MNKKINLFNVVLFLFSLSVLGQKEDNVLLKIDNTPVYQSEFTNLFCKNSDISNAENKQSIEKDLELFIDYKLKLVEAKELQLDTSKAYKKEVSMYRNQLAIPYLKDDTILDSLVVEAYERSLKEIKGSHILVRVDEKSTDTVAAYNKILKARKEVLSGKPFGEVALEYSEDPSVKSNKGNLGYFSVFKMVYPFESGAYNTPKGEVSEILRTSFGYHIIKVYDVRPSLGDIRVAHIMVRDLTANGKEKIDKLYKELVEGGDFAVLAEKHSDDRRSATEGGVLKRFPMGGMPKPFDEVSFTLSEKNKYSKPFKTAYGWHIVKFIELYPIPTFEMSKEKLTRMVKTGDRFKKLPNPVVNKLEKKYTIAVNEAAKKAFETPNVLSKKDSLNSWLITIEKDTIWQKGFISYIKNRRDKAPATLFQPYYNSEVLKYHKAHLEENNEEFATTFQEYKNGLLLFDLMKLKIWDKSQKDTLGLEQYFNRTYKSYVSKPSAKAIIISSKNSADITALKAELKKSDEAFEALRTDIKKREGVLLKEGTFEQEGNVFPNNTLFEEGSVNTYQENGYTYLVKILKVKGAEQEVLSDIKGKVIGDYQNLLQDQWLQNLRKGHSVKVVKSTVKNIRQENNCYSE